MTLRRQKKLRAVIWLICVIILTIIYVIGSSYTYEEREKPVETESDFSSSSKERGDVLAFDAKTYIKGEKSRKKDPLQKHAFNIRASDALSVDRDLPDTRDFSCLKEAFSIPSKVSVSVIISFHNEARSALLRTVVSVLNRSPEQVLKEIILVDDYSDDASDGAELSVLPKVRILRNTIREGLARSRAFGAAASSSDYLVFLDSHCEVNTGWLQPLIGNLLKHPKELASPVIDIIDQDTFKYKASSGDLKGGIDWRLNFRWQPLSKEEKLSRKNVAQTFKSPILPGGLFMAKKSWFEQIGGFDKGLEIWGAENIELSLKNWLCGEGVRVVPCSRVGHVFRKRHPYTFPPNGSASAYLRNARRIATVWLDEYKQQFYEALPKARTKFAETKTDTQIQVRQRLDCKPFQWFLDKVYPELRSRRKDTMAFGKLQQGNLCLDGHYNEAKNTSALSLVECKSLLTNEEWSFSKNGYLHLNNTCLTGVEQQISPIYLYRCNNQPDQKWIRKRRLLVHQQSGLCLESSTAVKNPLLLSPCQRRTYTQQWDFSMELQAWGDR